MKLDALISLTLTHKTGFIPQYEIILLNTFTIQVVLSSIFFIQLHVVCLTFEILVTTILHIFNI